MHRMFAVATILSLSTAAQAEDSLASRIHDAAVKACAAKVGDNLPLIYYRALSTHCADSVSADVMARILARQVAKTNASTATN